MRSILHRGLIVVALLSVLPTHANVYSDREIKAVYLYNFANFVHWPNDAFENPESPLRYCVTGDPTMADLVRELIDGERVGTRQLVLVDEPGVSKLRTCHVLFIGSADGTRVTEILMAVRDATVLTVSDDADSSPSGVMIRLSSRKRRVHPVIDLQVVDAGRLRISAKLLQLATVVRGANAGDAP